MYLRDNDPQMLQRSENMAFKMFYKNAFQSFNTIPLRYHLKQSTLNKIIPKFSIKKHRKIHHKIHLKKY